MASNFCFQCGTKLKQHVRFCPGCGAEILQQAVPEQSAFPTSGFCPECGDPFNVDDVEVNFAKALQYSLTFYDANKCGAGITDGYLEWRGDCHVEDYNIPLQPLEIVNEKKHMQNMSGMRGRNLICMS